MNKPLWIVIGLISLCVAFGWFLRDANEPSGDGLVGHGAGAQDPLERDPRTRDSGTSQLVPLPNQERAPELTQSTEPGAAHSSVGSEREAVRGPRPAFEFDLTMIVVDRDGMILPHRDLHLGYGLKDHRDHFARTQTIPFPVRTDEAGRIHRPVPVSNAEQRFLSIWVYEPGTSAKAFVDPVAIAPDKHVDLGEVALLEPRERFPVPILAGRVLSEQGRPVEALNVIWNRSAFSAANQQKDSAPWPGGYGSQVVIEPNGRFTAYGPPGIDQADVTFHARGFASENLVGIAVPSLDLQVTLSRKMWFNGRLLVPEDGPSPSEYLVWITTGNTRRGITVRDNGDFQAPGTSQSTLLEITQRHTGLVLDSREFHAAPQDSVVLGNIDLRPKVRVVSAIITDSEGQAIDGQEFQIEVLEPIHELARYSTDGQGRMQLVVPWEIERLRIGKLGERRHEVVLAEWGPTWALPGE